jgi:hypothetical protein
MNRIQPVQTNSIERDMCTTRKTNIKKWFVIFGAFPLSYLMLPISCCVRNPAAKIYNPDPDPNEVDYMTENILMGCNGITNIICCCGCFLGNCGRYGPEEC